MLPTPKARLPANVELDPADELRESEERFRLAFAHASTGLALLNTDSRYVKANGAFCAMLGYQEHELLGRHFSDITHANDLRACYEHHREVRTDPDRARPRELRLVGRDGRPIWTRIALSLVPDEQGRPLYVLCEVEDISAERADNIERQRVEEQIRRAQRMEAVGRLAGGVAHEFNNALSVILNNLDFTEKRLPTSGDVRPFLAAIREASMRSNALVQKLMVFGRCDVLPPKVLDLNQVAASLEPLLRRRLGDDIELVLSLEGDLWRIYLAPNHAEQILTHLAVNAKEAMPRGGRLTVGTRNVELDQRGVRGRVGLRPGRYVQIVIDDTGVGMTHEVLSRAFEPFFTTKPPGEGPGLGLSIVYGIVEEAGGHIHAESAPGAGTRLEILIPATDLPVQGVERNDAGPIPRGRGETVLVVEDEPAIRDLVRHILTESGYSVWVASGPEEALQRLMNDQAGLDLLLTDVIMPRLSGTDLAAYVQALRPQVKVLFMSGRADEHIGRQRVRRNEVAFLQKPFDAAELLRAVRRVLEPAEQPLQP